MTLSSAMGLALQTVLGDVNGDGRLETVVSSAGKLYVIGGGGAVQAGWPRNGDAAAVGDLDGDGDLELVCGLDAGVKAYRADGSTVPGWPVSIAGQQGVPMYWPPTLADVTGDGAVDVIVREGANQVFAWEGDGTPLSGFPLQVGSTFGDAAWGVESSLAAADINGDGTIDLVTGCGETDTKIYAFNAPGVYDPAVVEWGQFQYDPQHTGAYGGSPPQPNFSAAPTQGGKPLTVAFTDLSAGSVNSWEWNFGDGGTSTVRHPSHTYRTIGDFSVTLTATGPGGSDDLTKGAYIHVNDTGTVGAYPANEGAGSALGDTSGLGNNATIYGPTWVAGPDGGYALTFDGFNDYVRVLDDDSLDLTSEITLEALIRPRPGTLTEVIIAKNGAYGLAFQGQGTSGRLIGIVQVAGARHFLYGTSQAIPADAATWTRVAATYDSGSRILRLYVNGMEDAATTLSGLPSYEVDVSGTNLCLGGLQGKYPFWGAICQFRVVAADVYTLGDVCRLPLEEGSGTTTADISGSGNDAELVAASWTASGRVGKAVSLDGASSQLQVPDSSSLDISQELTLEAWIKPELGNGTRVIAVKPGSYALVIQNGHLAAALDFGSGWVTTVGSATIPTDGSAWTQARLTYQATTRRVKIYVNGKVDRNRLLTGLPSYTIAPSSADVYFGGPSPYRFKGKLDQVRISSDVR